MSRIKLDVPGFFLFCTPIAIRITDINYGGHVGNDTILSLIHEARVLFLRHYQLTEMDFGGVGLIMNDAAIEFKSELFYGDALKAYVTILNISRVSFDLFYKLVKNEEEQLVAIAKTGMVCFNYDTKKIAAVPEAPKKIFSSI